MTQIVFKNGKAIGINVMRQQKEIFIRAKKGVISAVGFNNTFKKLAPIDDIPVPTWYKHNVKRVFNEIQQSAQHFQVCFVLFCAFFLFVLFSKNV